MRRRRLRASPAAGAVGAGDTLHECRIVDGGRKRPHDVARADRVHARPHHLAGDSLRDDEHAGQVDALRLVPALARDVQERLRIGDPGVAHEHVDAAEPLHGRADDAVDVLAAGDVALFEHELRAVPAGELEAPRCGFQVLVAAVEDDDVRPLAQEAVRGRLPDAERESNLPTLGPPMT
jgi:hypothetical protein